MRITGGYIDGFGCLRDKRLSFGDGLNSFSSENGTGKSTLVAFIKAMLFGIGDTKRTSLYDNERRRYSPWGGGKFGGSLTVKTDRGIFRIERSFGKRPSEDSFRLFDAESGRESYEYGENIGEVLLGIDADGAERTIFLTEKNLLPGTESPALSAAVSGAVGNVTEADSLRDALLILDKQRRRYVKKGGGGELDACREKIAAAKRRLSGLDALIQRERAENEEFSLIKERLEALDSDAGSVRVRQSELVGRGKTCLSVFFILSLALTAVCAAAGFLFNPLLYIAAGVFGVLGTVLILASRRHCTSRAMADYERLDCERGDIDAERLRLVEERAELMRRHDMTLEAISEIRQTQVELEWLCARLSELESELSVIREAARRLTLANEALAKRHLGGAEAAFKRYLDAFSESEGLNLDTELKVSKTEGGETHPYESYSRATRDLYAFAARLAAADAVFGGKTPFIVLDDPFCAFDDRRLALALDFLRELAGTRQVIYFTASKSRLPR